MPGALAARSGARLAAKLAGALFAFRMRVANRTKLNFVLDSAALVGVALLSATGLLIRYVLPPGSGGLTGGHGWRAAERPVSLVWGMTRHEWGEVHFWIAIGLMVTLTLHLVLHWRWIVQVVRGRKRERAGMRVALGLLGLLALVIVTVGPLLTPKTQTTRGELRALRGQSARSFER